jgi:ATP synthase protein I
MLGFTFRTANNRAAEDPKQGVLILYMSAVIRFILLAVLFVIGLAWLKLDPMAVVLTFVVMQAGQMFNLQGKRRLTD